MDTPTLSTSTLSTPFLLPGTPAWYRREAKKLRDEAKGLDPAHQTRQVVTLLDTAAEWERHAERVEALKP